MLIAHQFADDWCLYQVNCFFFLGNECWLNRIGWRDMFICVGFHLCRFLVLVLGLLLGFGFTIRCNYAWVCLYGYLPLQSVSRLSQFSKEIFLNQIFADGMVKILVLLECFHGQSPIGFVE